MDSNSRDPLSDALARWRVRPVRDPGFRAAVAQRIDAHGTLSWTGWLRGNLVSWSVLAAFAVIAAGWSGRALAESRLEARREAMVVSYLSGLDPRVLAKLQP